MNRDAGADVAHDQPRRTRRHAVGRQDRLGLRLSVHVEKDETRAERITVDGKTIEMR